MVVVGAGITGLTTAVLLARAGKRVVVIEARYVGAGATGNTTGKVSLLQGTKLSRIAAKHGNDVLRSYVAGNQEGRDWLVRHCDTHGLDLQTEDVFSYAQTAGGVADARAELDACRAAGLTVDWVDEADVPFPFHGGVRMRDQAQIDPMPLSDQPGRRTGDPRRPGAAGPSRRIRLRPQTSSASRSAAVGHADDRHFTVTTQQCVLATGIPILDRGGYFARVKPKRSYCLAFDVPGDVTTADVPVRRRPDALGALCPTARRGEAHRRRCRTHRRTRRLACPRPSTSCGGGLCCTIPAPSRPTSGQPRTTRPSTRCPTSAHCCPVLETILLATGFDKWGMTNGVAAAPGAVQPHPRRADGLVARVRQLAHAGNSPGSAPRCRPTSRSDSPSRRAGSHRSPLRRRQRRRRARASSADRPGI